MLWVEENKCQYFPLSPVGMWIGRPVSAKSSGNSLHSKFLQWIKDTRLNADFYKINLLNKLLLVSCLGIWLYLSDWWRDVSSSEFTPVHVLHVFFWCHANITVYFYSFAFPHLSNIVVTRKLVLIWCSTSARTNEWASRSPQEKREASVTQCTLM